MFTWVFKDIDFNIRSSFLHEVVDSDTVLALKRCHIRKCVIMDIGENKFVCSLPCRL